MKLLELIPAKTDRAVLVGMTGSGKTTLAMHLLRYSPHVVAIDPKGLLNWQGYQRFTTLAEAVKCEEPKIIYAPKETELRDTSYHEAFFAWIYQRGNCTLYVDEVFGVAFGNRLPPHYHACLTRGRERGIATYSSTQRPVTLPNVILSESEKWFVFRLSMPGDRKKVEETVAISNEAIVNLKKMEFFHVTAEDQTPRGPLKLDLTNHHYQEEKNA